MENIKIIFAVLAVKIVTGFINLLKVLLPICALAGIMSFIVFSVYTVIDQPNRSEVSSDSPLNDWVAYKTFITDDGEHVIVSSSTHMEP